METIRLGRSIREEFKARRTRRARKGPRKKVREREGEPWLALGVGLAEREEGRVRLGFLLGRRGMLVVEGREEKGEGTSSKRAGR